MIGARSMLIKQCELGTEEESTLQAEWRGVPPNLRASEFALSQEIWETHASEPAPFPAQIKQ